MNVIVVFECSGVVRDAFLAAGHNAFSCDMKPNYTGPHIRCDAKQVDYSKFDIVIMHPPCTHLSVSGALHFKHKKKEQAEALELARWCFELKVPRKAIENPVSILSTHFREPEQIVQPWWFGDNAKKTTCLWLQDLPRLVPTHSKPEHIKNFVLDMPPSSTRAADRSRTFPGLARAMALQWGQPMLLF